MPEPQRPSLLAIRRNLNTSPDAVRARNKGGFKSDTIYFGSKLGPDETREVPAVLSEEMISWLLAAEAAQAIYFQTMDTRRPQLVSASLAASIMRANSSLPQKAPQTVPQARVPQEAPAGKTTPPPPEIPVSDITLREALLEALKGAPPVEAAPSVPEVVPVEEVQAPAPALDQVPVDEPSVDVSEGPEEVVVREAVSPGVLSRMGSSLPPFEERVEALLRLGKRVLADKMRTNSPATSTRGMSAEAMAHALALLGEGA